MAVVSIETIIRIRRSLWTPDKTLESKDKPFIFTERNGIYIIDLQKTVKLIDKAYNYVREVTEDGGNVLFVGTKKQAQDAIQEEAKRAGAYYINHRWLGGTLTNWDTIKKRIKRLKDLEKMEEDGTFEVLPKKEVGILIKERDRLDKFLGGIKDMPGKPDALFIVDPRKEHIAVKEAQKLNIPIVAMVDTNCDPDDVDVIIPSNDDAIRAVKLLTKTMADAIIEGNQGEESFEEEAKSDSLDEIVEVVEGDNE